MQSLAGNAVRLVTHGKMFSLNNRLQLNKYVQVVQIPGNHIGKQLTVDVIFFKTTLPAKNAMLWQNPKQEDVSNCLE